MKSFIAIYNFVIFGTVILIHIMSYEGNYMDGLMVRKESIYSLLKAKYYLYSLGVLIPFILMIPAMIVGKLTVLAAVSYMFFTVGIIYFALFQLAVYNNKTVPLNIGIAVKRNNSTAYQNLIGIGVFSLPFAFYHLSGIFLGENIAQWALLILGLTFTLTAHIWIKNVYNRFMARRYKNMEGFRNSK
jgi:hypothetical protein